MECASSRSAKQCTCTYPGCDRRGDCCKCVAYHQTRGEIPGCLFTPQGERTYDRSRQHFIRDCGKLP